MAIGKPSLNEIKQYNSFRLLIITCTLLSNSLIHVKALMHTSSGYNILFTNLDYMKNTLFTNIHSMSVYRWWDISYHRDPVH